MAKFGEKMKNYHQINLEPVFDTQKPINYIQMQPMNILKVHVCIQFVLASFIVFKRKYQLKSTCLCAHFNFSPYKQSIIKDH